LLVVQMKAGTFFWLCYEQFIPQYYQLTVHIHPCSSFDATKENKKKHYSGSRSSERTSST
jgi:hypothetical protein